MIERGNRLSFSCLRPVYIPRGKTASGSVYATGALSMHRSTLQVASSEAQQKESSGLLQQQGVMH